MSEQASRKHGFAAVRDRQIRAERSPGEHRATANAAVRRFARSG